MRLRSWACSPLPAPPPAAIDFLRGTKAKRTKKCGHSCLETPGPSHAESPQCLLDDPPKGCIPLGTTLVARQPSPTPRSKAGGNGGAWSSLSCPLPAPTSSGPLSIRPSIHHHLSPPLGLAPGVGEGELNGGSSLKSCPPSTVREGGSTFFGKGRREQGPTWVRRCSGEGNSKGMDHILMPSLIFGGGVVTS